MQFHLNPLWLLWRAFLLNSYSLCKSSLLNMHPLISSLPAQLWIEEIDPLLEKELFMGASIFLESITTKSHERKLKDFKTCLDELSGWKGLYLHFSNFKHLRFKSQVIPIYSLHRSERIFVQMSTETGQHFL